jgi:hypothetical protein
MIVVIAISAFIRNVYTVWCLFTLCWCSMVFGYWAEVVNRPIFEGGRPVRWELSGRGAPEKLVVPPMFAAFQRLVPHLLGWFPYAVIWIVCVLKG